MNARRFLLMKTGFDVNVLFLDTPGSCSHTDSTGSLSHTRFHGYRDPDGKRQVVLCPNGLEASEWSRVFVDDPPGSWTTHFANYRSAPPQKREYNGD